jgi:hypothetical protein
MAFQVGSQVRPELGRADVSGFARAGEYYGQAMANLGEQIGNAVTKYAVNKQKKEDKKLRYESILPYTTSMFGAEEGEKMAQTFSNDPKLGAQILEFAGMQQDQAALQQAVAVSTTTEGDIDPNTILPSFIHFGGRDVKGVAKLIEELRGPGELLVDPDTGVVQQGGEFKGITKVNDQGDQKPTAKTQDIRLTGELLKKARDAYNRGDDTEARNIFLQLGYVDKITGRPLDLEDQFGERQPQPESNVPSLSDSGEGERTQKSLDELVSQYSPQ